MHLCNLARVRVHIPFMCECKQTRKQGQKGYHMRCVFICGLFFCSFALSFSVVGFRSNWNRLFVYHTICSCFVRHRASIQPNQPFVFTIKWLNVCQRIPKCMRLKHFNDNRYIFPENNNVNSFRDEIEAIVWRSCIDEDPERKRER